jgi:hypothetical protein
MSEESTYQREQRLLAIRTWSQSGVLQKRKALPIEIAFSERVNRTAGPFFRPVALGDSDSVPFHRQVSYLIDAFDALPERVDVAFDSAWKAFESASTEVVSGHITDRLKLLALRVDSDIVDSLTRSIPVQSCEFLFKRLVSDVLSGDGDERVERRLNSLQDEAVMGFVLHLRSTYGSGGASERRNGALLLRRVLAGEKVTLGGQDGFSLTGESRARILMSLFLYTARNDRFHGESFSPFVSSVAALRTFTHPYFAFLASYYLLITLWLNKSPEVLEADAGEVNRSLAENLEQAKAVFGHHWGR